MRRYQHAEIKKALVDMFQGKCAYCESKILHIDYGDIEHYRPKRGPRARPDLTFDWDNLLLACQVCNGAEHKGDRFPEREEGGPILDPCRDDPAEHLEFRYDDRARLASVYGKTRRGETTERLLGLNRPHLRVHRSAFVQKLLFIALQAGRDLEAAALFDESRRPGSEYSAFAKALLPLVSQRTRRLESEHRS
jgi:uncharacterized protein (TIGR02646 family)